MAKRGPKPKAKDTDIKVNLKATEKNDDPVIPPPDPVMDEEVGAMFDPVAYKELQLQKARIDAEVQAQVKQERKVKLDIDMDAQKKRKPSPEDIVMKTHPEIKCSVMSPGQEVIEFTWGGVRQRFAPNTPQSLPYGLIDHLRHDCIQPKYGIVAPQPGETDQDGNPVLQKTGIVGYEHAYHVTIIDDDAWMKAKEQVKELGYIPIPERGQHAQTSD